MSVSLAEIRAEYDRLDALCGADTRSIALKVSGRAKKRLGSFQSGANPCITLSSFVLEDDALALDTARHEYAHALVWLRHPGERHVHDALWKAACREVGCTPRATLPCKDSVAQRASQAQWLMRCLGCGQETYYLRAGKIVQLVRDGHSRRVTCLHCGGHRFSLTKLR